MRASDRPKHEPAVTDHLDGQAMRRWHTDTDTRRFWVRQGHKRRRAWGKREIRRQLTAGEGNGARD